MPRTDKGSRSTCAKTPPLDVFKKKEKAIEEARTITEEVSINSGKGGKEKAAVLSHNDNRQ